MNLGAVIVIPYPAVATERDKRDFLDASLQSSSGQGRTVSEKAIAGMAAVETIGSATTKGWSLPLGRYGLIVTGENEATDDVTRQMIDILTSNP